MGILLLLPLFLVRFGLLYILDPAALPRAAHFPPMVKGEKAAYWVYQSSNVAILLLILFATPEDGIN